MKINSIVAGAALIALAGSVQMAKANIIPYPSPNNLNTTTYSFTANGGDVTAYFAGASAGHTDILGLYVNGSTIWSTLNNQISAVGSFYDFGTFTLNTPLVFVLEDTSTGNTLYYSDPSMNADGINHIYSTSYDSSGTPNLGAGIPSGTFVSFEDLYGGGDKDYNDLQFVFENVTPGTPGQTSSSVPEPSTVVAGALLLLPFGVSTLRVLRNRKLASR